MVKKKPKLPSNIIALNKKAYADYFIEKEFEAGVALQGWEVKSLRAGKAQLPESYILLKKDEAWIIGLHIAPLIQASTHVHAEPDRTRKLLLHKKEILLLMGSVQQKGYTCIPLKLYWTRQKVKCKIALVRGKREYDKRHSIKDREWAIQKNRLLKHSDL